MHYTIEGVWKRVCGWCSTREVLPRHRAMARQPKRWHFVVAGSDEPDPTDVGDLVEMLSSARQPSISATKGTHPILDAQ